MGVMFKGLGGLTRDSKPVFIAEACENHLGSLNKALLMVVKAKEGGAKIIKFQHHIRDKEMKKGMKMSDNFSEDLYEFLGKNSLTIEEHITLKKKCDEVGIEYLCTPFCKEAAEELIENNLVSTVKIGSGEMEDYRLLSYLSEKKISMILSTGMSTIQEIDNTVKFLTDKKADFCLLHCISEYPPKTEDAKIDTVTLLKDKYPELVIGLSCHSKSLTSIIAGVALGAVIIEKHVTLDESVDCPDKEVSISFEKMKEGIDMANETYQLKGIREGVLQKEREIRSWARRVIVASKDINMNEVISEKNITTMRAGEEGISSSKYFQMIGKKAMRAIISGKVIGEGDLA